MKESNEEFKLKLERFLDAHGVYVTSYDSYNGDDEYVGSDYYFENRDGSISLHIDDLK